jgi:peptide/nickel transport system permease protein
VFRLIVRRLLFGIVLLWAVSLIVFVATESLPGDPARIILGQYAPPAELAALRVRLHLNEPILTQYLSWLGDAVRFQFGKSLANGLPVSSYISPRIINSLVLMLISAVISTPIALFGGIWAAVRRDSVGDHVQAITNLVLLSLPEFVIGIALIFMFATGILHLVPGVVVATGGHPWEQPEQLILPVLTLCLLVAPYIARLTRAVFIEALEADYVEYARLKGVSEREVLLRHALPNALGPIVQLVALELAYLAGGIVVVETVFNYPGIGAALASAVSNRDLPVIQALVLVIAVTYVGLNLVADLATLASDPRVRTAGR